MALVKVKPTSAGRRAVVKVVNSDLHKGAPVAALIEKKNSKAGRNNHGRITTRHKGGGHKQNYRVVDFRRAQQATPEQLQRAVDEGVVIWPGAGPSAAAESCRSRRDVPAGSTRRPPQASACASHGSFPWLGGTGWSSVTDARAST